MVATSTRDYTMFINGEWVAGNSGVNDHMPLTSEMPHGGLKQSGFGKDMSIYALEDYTQIKHVMVELTGQAYKNSQPDEHLGA